MMKYEVLGHRVLIKPELQSEQTEWGFELGHTDTFQRELGATQIGTIVSIGPNAWLDYKSVNAKGEFIPGLPWAALGDKVQYAKYAGKEIRGVDNKIEYVIINDEDVQCKIHDEEESE